jgi:hypothetical protein
VVLSGTFKKKNFVKFSSIPFKIDYGNCGTGMLTLFEIFNIARLKVMAFYVGSFSV